MSTSFCVTGENIKKCPQNLEFFIYEDSSELVGKLLYLLKEYLPKIAINFKDCFDKPIKILKDDIVLTPPTELPPPIMVMLVPTDDVSTYGEDFSTEDSGKRFDLFLQVRSEDFDCNVWNLLKLQSIVKTFLMKLQELLRDGNLIQINDFKFLGAEPDGKYYNRSGIYRFTATKRDLIPKTISL